MSSLVPAAGAEPVLAVRAMATAAHELAAGAAVRIMGAGGNAADGAVAAAAVMAVVAPQLCGLGGDMLAMVQAPGAPPEALLGIGRSGSGADPARLRAEGFDDMPLQGDIRTVPVPGAVDGWLELHARYGRSAWRDILVPAVELAAGGFEASAQLALASKLVAAVPGATDLCPDGPLTAGQIVRLPGVARTLEDLAAGGRDGFYAGAFGRALIDVGGGEYSPGDLAEPMAQWVAPIALDVFGHRVHTVPPPSQAYLTLAGAWVAEHAGLPHDPDDDMWPHLMARSMQVTGSDRPDVLFDGADPELLLAPERLEAFVEAVLRGGVGGSSVPGSPPADGDTTHLCVVDEDGLGVSLTQSNALGFGSHIVAGETGVFLHNRGIGFNLVPGHGAEYGPRRRPSHTLCPAVVTDADGTLVQLIGTMGGDAQPQIVAEVLARQLLGGQDPAAALRASRVVLEAPGAKPFRMWQAGATALVVESHAPPTWVPGLRARGHEVRVADALGPVVAGCAQVIAVQRDGTGERIYVGASDPRSPTGGCIGR
ncbi:MAG: gamma-glutamyltransferase [Acidimicrobiales bacterium]